MNENQIIASIEVINHSLVRESKGVTLVGIYFKRCCFITRELLNPALLHLI